MNSISIVIPHIARNNNLLIQNIPYILKNISPKHIYILTKKETIEELNTLKSANITFIDEDTVLEGLTFEGIKELLSQINVVQRRTGWFFQQFLKYAWALKPEAEEYYITWDSDTFPIQPVSFFQDNKPIFIKKDEYNPAYFETIQRLLNINKCIPDSFIAETMIFKTNIVKEIISKIESNSKLKGNTFYEKILYAIQFSQNPCKGYSEFETYGTYVITNYPDLYTFRQSKGFRNGAKYYGLRPSKKDLSRASLKYDIISFERWNKQIKAFILFQKMISAFIYMFFHRS